MKFYSDGAVTSPTYLPRPRNRVELAESTQHLHYRKAVIAFLYTRQGHVEKQAA